MAKATHHRAKAKAAGYEYFTLAVSSFGDWDSEAVDFLDLMSKAEANAAKSAPDTVVQHAGERLGLLQLDQLPDDFFGGGVGLVIIMTILCNGLLFSRRLFAVLQ